MTDYSILNRSKLETDMVDVLFAPYPIIGETKDMIDEIEKIADRVMVEDWGFPENISKEVEGLLRKTGCYAEEALCMLDKCRTTLAHLAYVKAVYRKEMRENEGNTD